MVKQSAFGELKSGEKITLVHLENKNGAYAQLISFGAYVVKICVPDKEHKLRDVVLGYDDLASYTANPSYFGACVGRNCNRIANAGFALNGKEIRLQTNDGPNNLHSGPEAFEKKVWDIRRIDEKCNSVTFGRISPDGENGFPGNFDITVTYTFTEDNELKIIYDGICDQDTVVNMTNHSYFNLNGEGSGSILDHMLELKGTEFVPVGGGAIPFGTYQKVEGTPFDFTTAKQMGQDINEKDEQLEAVGGYDHHFAVEPYEPGRIREVAKAWSKDSGICLNVFTSCPGVQFYAGNFIEPESGKNGHFYKQRDGFALETQHEPNAVNTPAFHSTVLKSGNRYHSETIYAFSIIE